MRQFHTIAPLFDARSEVLILGTFPSVKSREGMFFYHHPQNRFWRVLSAVLNCLEPASIPEKREMILRSRIALWDVIASCEIEGSDDNSISSVVPNDLSIITMAASIRHVFTNGGTAHRLYKRFGQAQTGIEAVKLPSTSPANARFNLDKLIEEWSAVSDVLNREK
jgi:hypoxanthine-DNA glycosylase